MSGRRDKIDFLIRLENKIRSMSSRELLKNFVEGLKEHPIYYKEFTFGYEKDGNYYGDVACFTIINIMKHDTVDSKSLITPRFGSYNDGFHSARRFFIPECDELFFHFENALDHLGKGDVYSFNKLATLGGFCNLKWCPSKVGDLPRIRSGYGDNEISKYRKLLEFQELN